MRRLRALALNLVLSVLAVGLLVGVCEGALRVFPRLLPKGFYGASHYRPDLMSSVYGDTVVYNKVRFVVRKPNSEGFLDVEHERARPPGVRRIGIFGDSYVEAVQVPLGQVFYREAGEKLAADHVELLGFGMSGWGTLHAFLACKQLAPRYDLDAVVYVFVENDLGDNMLEVQGVRSFRLSPKAYATLSPLPPGYELVLKDAGEQFGAAYVLSKWFQENLLLGRLVWSRTSLLIREGVALTSKESDRLMTTRSGEVPHQNDLPSSWPVPVAERAKTLGARILGDWAHWARESGLDLFVLYIPRGEAALVDREAAADTWQAWLEETTQQLGIPLIDPSDALRQRLQSGDSVYDDHFTPAGHEAVADVLSARLREWSREKTQPPE